MKHHFSGIYLLSNPVNGTSCVLFFVLNMIGLGLGPLVTGLLSDLLQPSFGDQSLRYAMAMTALGGFVSLLLFYMAARRLPEDLRRAASVSQATPAARPTP